MKTRKILLFTAIAACLTLLSFSTDDMLKVNEENTTTASLEEQKTALTAHYTNLIKEEIDRRFAESKDGMINEKEMNATLATFFLPEYGCAYRGSGCTGRAVCGVSKLYAETFGYASWSGETSGCN